VRGTDGRVAAVIGLAVYPLQHLAGDRFTNPSGQDVVFERDASGRLLSVRDGNGRYPFRSGEVPPRMRLLLHPRPAGTGKWRYNVPEPEADLPTTRLQDAGVDERAVAALMESIASDPAFAHVHSLLLYRHGKLVLEEYFYGYGREDPHDLRSATKSFHAALAGTAVREGVLTLDTPIWAELADARAIAIAPALRRVTLSYVLDMRTGLACDDFDERSPGRETAVQRSADWVDTLLRLPVSAAAPGTGHYCSAAVAGVGQLIELKTGRPLHEYAAAALFEPVGIQAERTTWDFSPAWKGDQHVAALFMRPRDMLRFGRLYLGRGTSGTRRVLDERWIDATFEATTRVGTWRRYSRFWWTWEEDAGRGSPRVEVHAAMGNGGQEIIVVPSLDAVIVMTGGNFNRQEPVRPILAALLSSLSPSQHGRIEAKR
jgi:CubicO group peptidase (beta-lactamase class C family)